MAAFSSSTGTGREQQPGAGAGHAEAVEQAAVEGAQLLVGPAGELERALQPATLGRDLVGVEQRRRHRRLVDEQRRAGAGLRRLAVQQVVRHRAVPPRVRPQVVEQLERRAP